MLADRHVLQHPSDLPRGPNWDRERPIELCGVPVHLAQGEDIASNVGEGGIAPMRPEHEWVRDRTLLDEHFRVEGRRTWFETIEEMQVALDKYLVTYNRKRPHQGRGMHGHTPWQAFRDGLPGIAKTSKMTEQEERKAA